MMAMATTKSKAVAVLVFNVASQLLLPSFVTSGILRVLILTSSAACIWCVLPQGLFATMISVLLGGWAFSKVSSISGPALSGNAFAPLLALLLTLMLAYSWQKKPFPNATPFPFNKTALGELVYLSIMIKLFYGGDGASYFRSLRKRLGCTFFLGKLFSQPSGCPTLVLMHPDDQAAFIRKDKDLELHVLMPETVTKIHGERNFQNLSVGPAHAALRKIYGSILSPKSLARFTQISIEYFLKMWDDLEQSTEKKSFKIQDVIRDTQLKLMCNILYGFGEETEEDGQILSQFMKDFRLTEKALFSMIENRENDFQAGLEAKKRIYKLLSEKFDGIFDKRIVEYMGTGVSKQNKDFGDVVGNAMEQIVELLIQSGCKSKDDASFRDAKDNLYLLLEASHGTTMNVTTAMLFLVNHSDHRHILEQIREEVDGLQPTYANIKGFKYAEACVQETMRLVPVVGSISYFVGEGKSFSVKGSSFQGPMVVNFNNSNWYGDGEVFVDPTSFIPERWLAGDKQASAFAKSTFRPFGFGRHICLGNSLAKLVVNANIYCFASKRNRSIVFDEDKVKIVCGIFPAKSIKDAFPGTVVLAKEKEH